MLGRANSRLGAELSVTQKQNELVNQRVTALESERHHLQLKNSLPVEKLETSQSAHSELVKLHQEKLDAIFQLKAELSALRAEKHVWENIAQSLGREPK